MIYLLSAILSSAMISIVMRLSADKVSGGTGMLTMNYLTCTVIAGFYAGYDKLFPQVAALTQTLGLGTVHGVLFLLGFVLFQANVKKNGVVLSAIFMKLGLLVPLAVSIVLFDEMPTVLQWIGFCIAVAAIILINLQKDSASGKAGAGLVALLLAGGAADGMSKVYEQVGDAALAPQFLFYTFAAASLLCAGLAFWKKDCLGKNEVLFGCLIGIPNFFSAKFLLRALKDLPAVIVYPTFSVATILVVTLAGVLVFRERLSARQWVAIAAILVALVLLNI